MEWVEITTANVLAHMATDVLTRYNAWLVDNPTRTGRLAEITANTIREFRDAIKSNPANAYHATETYLPQSAVRHCEDIIFFTLCMEMGIDVDTAGQSSRVSADIFLRQITYGKWNTSTDSVSPSPSYEVPTASAGRTIAWALALLLWAGRVFAGWIEANNSISDINVFPTYAPVNYAITASTLNGHLAGIDGALAALAVSPENVVSMISPYTVPGGAPAWWYDTNGVYLLARNNDVMINFYSKAIAGDWILSGNWRWYYARTLTFYNDSFTPTATYGWNGVSIPSITLGTNAAISNWPSSLPLAGGTMAGALDMGGNAITNDSQIDIWGAGCCLSIGDYEILFNAQDAIVNTDGTNVWQGRISDTEADRIAALAEGSGISAETATNIAQTVVAAATTNEMTNINWSALGGGEGGTAIQTNAVAPVPLVSSAAFTNLISRGTNIHYFIETTDTASSVWFSTNFDATCSASILLEIKGTNELTFGPTNLTAGWTEDVWLRTNTVSTIWTKPYGETLWRCSEF